MTVPAELRSGTFAVLCVKCTREEFFGGADLAEGAKAAAKAGWMMRGDHMICPKCPR